MRRILLGLIALGLAGACLPGSPPPAGQATRIPSLPASPAPAGPTLPPVVSRTVHGVAGGAIVGGVDPCAALPNPSAPRYAKATVTLLRGTMSLKPLGNGVSQYEFPPIVVAKISVEANQGYRFEVDPGDYVLVAQFPQGNAKPWTSVSVAGTGQVLMRDIPNMCM